MPRYNATHKEASRLKVRKAAGEVFRSGGFGGIGVDGLAKQAGLTSGAFYVHFKSKHEAFVAALEDGLEDLRAGIERLQAESGEHWLRDFVDFYLTVRVECDLAEGCALPTLSSEAERVGPEARTVYETKLLEVAKQLASGLNGTPDSNLARAWEILALLLGGTTMARTVTDANLKDAITSSIRVAILG